MKETIAKINKTNSWFIEKINKIDKPLANSSRKKGRRLKSIDLTLLDTAEKQRIMRHYYKQLYANKMDNWEKQTNS